jgi:hypothetical protein
VGGDIPGDRIMSFLRDGLSIGGDCMDDPDVPHPDESCAELVLRKLLERLRLASDRASRLLLFVSSILISGELDDD